MLRSLLVATVAGALVLLYVVAGFVHGCDTVSRSYVNVTFSGLWTEMMVSNTNFTKCLFADIGAALGPQRAGAWLTKNVNISSGLAIQLEAWSDPGATVDRLLETADWSCLQGFLADQLPGAKTDAFVATASRSEDVLLTFTSNGTLKANVSEVELAILDDVEVLRLSSGSKLKASIAGRTTLSQSRLLVRLTVLSDSSATVTHTLRSSPWENLEMVYKEHDISVVHLADISAAEIPQKERACRTHLLIPLSGSGGLVVECAAADVLTALQADVVAALSLNPGRVITGNFSTKDYPYQVETNVYVFHDVTMDIEKLVSSVTKTNFTTLHDVYSNHGGCLSVKPQALLPVEVAYDPMSTEMHDHTEDHFQVYLTGNDWERVHREANLEVLTGAIQSDLRQILPDANTTSFTVEKLLFNGFSLSVLGTTRQWGRMKFDPYHFAAFFMEADQMELTTAIYVKTHVRNRADADLVSISVAFSRYRDAADTGSACDATCIGMSIVGGVLVLLTIILVIMYCTWWTLWRQVEPSGDSNTDLVHIPAEKNPLKYADRAAPMYAVLPCPQETMVPPLGPSVTGGPPPFGPHQPISGAANPEARMTSFIPMAPPTRETRVDNVVIPSSMGDDEFEIVVMPREEYERSVAM